MSKFHSEGLGFLCVVRAFGFGYTHASHEGRRGVGEPPPNILQGGCTIHVHIYCICAYEYKT